MAQTVIFTIDVDPNLVPDGDLEPLLLALEDFSPVLDSFAQTLAAGEKAGFTSQGAGYGLLWASPAASTLRQHEQRGTAFMLRSGNLAGSIGEAVNLSADAVQVGIDERQAPYADFLQSGTRRMPGRVLVAVTDDMIDAMMQTLREYLADATGGDMSGIDIVATAM